DNGNVELKTPIKQVAYINSSSSNGRNVCDTNSSSGMISTNCINTPASSNISAWGFDTTTINGVQYAYFAGFSGLYPNNIAGIHQCVIGNGGLLSDCHFTSAGAAWDNPSYITIATIESTQYAYIADIANGNVIITRCGLTTDGSVIATSGS